jgi:hypothetical protein
VKGEISDTGPGGHGEVSRRTETYLLLRQAKDES